MPSPSIIGLVGPIRAGKTTIARYLTENYGYVHASNSQVLVDILGPLNLAPTRDNLQLLGNSIFEHFGNDAIARFRVATRGSKKLIIDGIRYIEEVECYRHVDGFKLLAVDAVLDTRFERALSAGDSIKDLGVDIEHFKDLSKSRSESQVPDLMMLADANIKNTSSLEGLRSDIDSLIKMWS